MHIYRASRDLAAARAMRVTPLSLRQHFVIMCIQEKRQSKRTTDQKHVALRWEGILHHSTISCEYIKIETRPRPRSNGSMAKLQGRLRTLESLQNFKELEKVEKRAEGGDHELSFRSESHGPLEHMEFEHLIWP